MSGIDTRAGAPFNTMGGRGKSASSAARRRNDQNQILLGQGDIRQAPTSPSSSASSSSFASPSKSEE